MVSGEWVAAGHVFEPLAAGLKHLAFEGCHLQAADVAARDAVFCGAAAAGVFGNVAGDKADLFAHRVAGE